MSKDVKLLAKNLGKKAKELGLEMTHSQSLELLAFTKGYNDWNAYAAAIKAPNKKVESIMLPKIAIDCITLVSQIDKCGGLMSRTMNEISDALGLEPEDVDAIMTDSTEYLIAKENAELNEFWKKFQEQKLNVFEFIINEESFYIVAKSEKEAEETGRIEISRYESLHSIRFAKILKLDQMMDYVFNEDSSIENPSFLKKLSTIKDPVPYIFARSDY